MQESSRTSPTALAENDKVVLRMDDVGAASKQNEQYSKRWRGVGNFLWLKRLAYFRAWGPYRELTAVEWDGIFQVLSAANARLTVAVTAAWVESGGTLVPFPKKFPDEAAKLREGMNAGLLEIANHGLTHCVLEGGKFPPRAFSSNRRYHREFWDWLPEETHIRHIRTSQEILEGYFQTAITTLVPPGNVYAKATLRAGKAHGITTVNCNVREGHALLEGLTVVGNESVIAFHDRELVLFGVDWLRDLLASVPAGTRYCFVKELGHD